jgi:hypothetical protein
MINFNIFVMESSEYKYYIILIVDVLSIKTFKCMKRQKNGINNLWKSQGYSQKFIIKVCYSFLILRARDFSFVSSPCFNFEFHTVSH